MTEQSAGGTSGKSQAMLLVHVPNLLSALRLCLAIAFPLLPSAWHWLTIVVAGVSDVTDGLIARRFNLGSFVGALLDAIADKLFVISVLLTLVFAGSILWWQVLLVLLRDFSVAVVAGYATLIRDWSAFGRMRPSVFGKVATGVIFAWLISVTAHWDHLHWPLFVLAAMASAAAAVDYLRRFLIAHHERRAAG